MFSQDTHNVSSLAKTSACKIEPSKKGAQSRKRFLCKDSPDEQNALFGLQKNFCLITCTLSLPFNKFLQSEIKQKLSLVQNINRITAISDKKIISQVCLFTMFCFSTVCGSNWKVSSSSFYFLMKSKKEEKRKLTRKTIKYKLDSSPVM